MSIVLDRLSGSMVWSWADGTGSGAYHPQKHPWIIRLLAKKPAKLVAVAVANKMTRIAWAIMAKGGYYRAPELAVAT